ncbi:MAG: LLM class flavin-dependent oxidoreductase, partial [Micrococcales bacterium]|nr:LLM class flavin-dependent oxidoreductase [Micrococcales bacterium]
MSAAPLALSVLDLVPVRTGQTSAQAVTASLATADAADRLGYRRYWFAEHHNTPNLASSATALLISQAA